MAPLPGTKITLLRTCFWMLVVSSLQQYGQPLRRNCVSSGSSVILEILLPRSAINSEDSGFQGPPVSTDTGTKWCVVASVLYFEILFAAAVFAAAPALTAVWTRWDAAYVSETVTSHARVFPRFQGIKVAPSGIFLSIRERPIDSLVVWDLSPLDRSPN